MRSNKPQGERITTTFRLPKLLHKRIRLEAAQTEREMTAIILEQLSLRYPDLSKQVPERQSA